MWCDFSQSQMPPFVITCGVSAFNLIFMQTFKRSVFFFCFLFLILPKTKCNFPRCTLVYFNSVSFSFGGFCSAVSAMAICSVAQQNLICFVHFLEAFVCHAFLHLNLRLICILCTSILRLLRNFHSQFCVSFAFFGFPLAVF